MPTISAPKAPPKAARSRARANKRARLPAADANGQLIVAMAIVVAMGLLGVALIVAGCVTNQFTVAWGAIGPITGALATALNAPTGTSSALRASRNTGSGS